MNLSLQNLKSHYFKRGRKRVGRGNSAGQGTYGGRGLKGQKARSGGSIRPGFEGGRTTLIAQTPKSRGKGFVSGRVARRGVNVEKLNVFSDGDVISLKKLLGTGIVKNGPVKILGEGKLTKKLEVRLPVSASAREKIEAAGGKIVLAEKKSATETKKEIKK